MPELLIYLLKVNVALVLFYLAYHVALRRLTFYHLNRLFLVFGIVFSTVYPFIDLASLFESEEQLAAAYLVTIPAWAYAAPTIAATPEAFDYWQLPVYLFWAGVMVMLVRFIVQLASLYKIHVTSEPANYRNIGFRKVKSISQAFSFWQTIYLNPEQHKHDELEKILHHELIHITGWHTLDVLLAELSTVFYWFNPGAWLMKKAVKENLEFIADQNVVNTGVDKKEYQYLLLKVVGATQPQIANQFNFPSLKRRIAMMNKMPTSKAGKLRLLIALPLAATLLFAFRNAAPTIDELSEELSKANLELQGENDNLQGNHTSFLKRNPNVKQLYWMHEDVLDKTSKLTRVVIERKDYPQFENFHLDNEKEMAAFESKYGKLPKAPETIIQQTGNSSSTEELIKQLKQNRAIKSVRSKKIDGKDAIVIGLKGGGTEVYFIGDATSLADLERKYVLPELPPPPPPAPAAPPAPPAPPVAEDNVPFIFSAEDVPHYKNNLPEDYKAFLKRNPQVKQLGWKFSDRIDYNLESIVIYLKNGKVETYDFNRNPRIPAVEAKYGQLPNLPAPPPPTARNLPAPPPPAPATPGASGYQIREQFNLNQTPGPTYYIDGVETSSEALKDFDTKQIHSINVFKGEDAKKALGDKAYYGVISIVTEKNKGSQKVIEFNKKLSPNAEAKTGSSAKKNYTTFTVESTNNPSTDAQQVAFGMDPDNINQEQFDFAENMFKQNGFDIKFKSHKNGEEITGVTITTKTAASPAGTTTYFSVDGLKKQGKDILINANKATGKVTVNAVTVP